MSDLHGGDVGFLGWVATVRLRDFGLGLANVLAGGVEGGRHDGRLVGCRRIESKADEVVEWWLISRVR